MTLKSLQPFVTKTMKLLIKKLARIYNKRVVRLKLYRIKFNFNYFKNLFQSRPFQIGVINITLIKNIGHIYQEN
ncbi:hypothetical protein BpHYR1_038109 [Brachionus plicatilis]|uniref:Uncharacterized protein n=1 Tax=Brachionus plicatilis TaxID=10195 RepID=A0A3M7Q4H3_BRAPC|nr:hypothetical protein BpHYR1_038109 [Brachionus plicatilis]